MNDTEKRIAIAEACGWKQITMSDWEAPDGMRHQNWGGLISCPDYLNDLNAMHEAEEVILTQGLQDHWLDNLVEVVVNKNVHWSDYHCFPQVNRATARQRADAFIKTLGLDKP